MSSARAGVTMRGAPARGENLEPDVKRLTSRCRRSCRVLAVIAGLSHGAAAARRSAPAIDIVSLNVTVTDGANHYITDLEQPDFSVFEDGVKQDVTFFNRRQQPIALSLLLDSSASMEDKLADAADGRRRTSSSG